MYIINQIFSKDAKKNKNSQICAPAAINLEPKQNGVAHNIFIEKIKDPKMIYA